MKEGWEIRPFVDCIKPVQPRRKIQRKDFLHEGRFPIVSQEAVLINGYWEDEADLLRVSKPVVIFGDHTQVLKYVDFDFVIGADGTKVLLPIESIETKFFYYQLQAASLSSLGYARHYRLLKELGIRVPPLPEQQRIVALLDEAFEGLATAKANAEQNLRNARALFQSHLESVLSQREEGWKTTRLGAEVDLLAGFAFKSAQYTNNDDGIRLLRGDNIIQGRLRWDDVKQ
jgi:type I restriction enzyme S subunit